MEERILVLCFSHSDRFRAIAIHILSCNRLLLNNWFSRKVLIVEPGDKIVYWIGGCLRKAVIMENKLPGLPNWSQDNDLGLILNDSPGYTDFNAYVFYFYSLSCIRAVLITALIHCDSYEWYIITPDILYNNANMYFFDVYRWAEGVHHGDNKWFAPSLDK